MDAERRARIVDSTGRWEARGEREECGSLLRLLCTVRSDPSNAVPHGIHTNTFHFCAEFAHSL